jgi:predicted negative regulator of RcsB-dependent stress response
MPDWCELVRQRLAGIRLDQDDAAQVFDELASHLEESYQTLRGDGVAEQAAVGRALERSTTGSN